MNAHGNFTALRSADLGDHLIPEQIRELHKDLPPVVDKAVPGAQQSVKALARNARCTAAQPL
jgi:hypothetical protein